MQPKRWDGCMYRSSGRPSAGPRADILRKLSAWRRVPATWLSSSMAWTPSGTSNFSKRFRASPWTGKACVRSDEAGVRPLAACTVRPRRSREPALEGHVARKPAGPKNARPSGLMTRKSKKDLPHPPPPRVRIEQLSSCEPRSKRGKAAEARAPAGPTALPRCTCPSPYLARKRRSSGATMRAMTSSCSTLQPVSRIKCLA
eukprot:11219416-Lingulodinium_polyedra.AAC.3